MEPRDHHAQLKSLFAEVYDLGVEERRLRLVELCDDESMRAEVEQLVLDAMHEDDGFADSAVEAPRDLTAMLGEMTELHDEPWLRSIPGFRFIRLIGWGGMGVVIEAEQETPRRRVAIKEIRPGCLSRAVLTRFRLEMEVLGRLQHPGIAQLYEVGRLKSATGDLPYFVMELINGIESRTYVREHGLQTRAVLELIARIADAVHHAHQRGIIHRDLKPDNVLIVDADSTQTPGTGSFATLGRPKVLDFGIARALNADVDVTVPSTGEGQLIGTVAYMSPEQIEGKADLDVRTDIYSIGVMAYEMLAGRLPHDVASVPVVEMARRIKEEQPTRLGVLEPTTRGDPETIIGKAMHQDREQRYQSAAELASDIRRYLSDEPILARPPSVTYQLSRFARRNRGLVGGSLAALVVLILGLIATIIFAVGETKQRHRAESALYRATLTSAARAIEAFDSVLCRAYLEDAPERLRGWEWDHLMSRTDDTLRRTDVLPDLHSVPHARINRDRGEFTIMMQSDSRTLIRTIDLASLDVVADVDLDLQFVASLHTLGPKGVYAFEEQPDHLITVRDTHSGEVVERVTIPSHPKGRLEAGEPVEYSTVKNVPFSRAVAMSMRLNAIGRWIVFPAFSGRPFQTVVLDSGTGLIRAVFDTDRDPLHYSIHEDRVLLIATEGGMLSAFDIEEARELPWSPSRVLSGNHAMCVTGFENLALVSDDTGIARWVDSDNRTDRRKHLS